MELDIIRREDPEVADLIEKELQRQQNTIELIASENFTSEAIMAAAGTVLTNKYAEGKPEKRYYNGCEVIDKIEKIAQERVCKLFGMAHANVQPHSGAQANMAVFLYALKPGDKVLSMDLSNGGHLSHGSPVNFSGLFFDVISYGVDENGIATFDIIPNPNQGAMTIITQGGKGDAEVKVYNMTGVLVDQFVLNTDSQGRYAYNLGGYPSGIYLMVFHQQGKNTTKKFVITK